MLYVNCVTQTQPRDAAMSTLVEFFMVRVRRSNFCEGERKRLAVRTTELELKFCEREVQEF